MERHRKWFIPDKECTPIQMHLYYCNFKQPYNYSCYMYKLIGTKACEKLYDVICNARLHDDVKKLSPHQQTSSLESYHSVINHFAPKLLALSYAGMHCRYL